MLQDKTAIVTGGSRGIGFAIAQKLTSLGTRVVICSRTEKELRGAVEKLGGLGVVADVSRFEDCQKLIDYAIAQTGRIDILVNNAGVFGPVGLLETNGYEEWEKALGINILGQVYCSKLAIPYMKKQGGGRIINLLGAGVGGTNAIPHFTAYYTTKTAVAGFTECLAEELLQDNIQVNAISPGAVASDLTLSLLNLPKENVGQAMYETSEKLKSGESTSPELAANLVGFLAGPEADGITGRLISAKWDDYKSWSEKKPNSNNLYRLRRIDNKMFLENKE